MHFESMWKELAPIGRTARGGYVRQPFTSVDHELRHWFRAAAAERAMVVEEDDFGNLYAWWGGVPTATTPGVLTGSHLDSVVDGGAYDGALGVVSGFAAVDLLRGRGVEPVRPVGVAAFVEEEGSRFGVACLGSRLATGAWTWERARQLRDRDGVWLRDAMASVLAQPGGGSGAGEAPLPQRVHAFVELHVEQGRGLVEAGSPVGLGSGIWPHGRYRFEVTGQANHAGTTPMEDRADPMLTYAMTVLAANKQARLGRHRATFGRVEVWPNGTNTVPSRVTAWLDARAATVPALQEFVATVSEQGEQRAGRDGTRLAVTPESFSGAVEFDRGLGALLAEGQAWPVLATAAGHDAGVLTEAGTPTAMLFVRNPTGISHAPEEHVELADAVVGVEALAGALERAAGWAGVPEVRR